jgi:hypothetical protein
MSAEHHGGGENIEDLPQKNTIISLILMVIFAGIIMPVKDTLRKVSSTVVTGDEQEGHGRH